MTDFPVVYENAVKALAICEKVDECKAWADKAKALASYAKQAEDKTLLTHSRRIQARAIRRAGELLGEIESATKYNLPNNQGMGTHPLVTRTSAAREAGLSKHQQVQAMRMARIPLGQFEQAMQQSDTPTVTELTEVRNFRQATSLYGELNKFSDIIEDCSPKDAANGFLDHEMQQAIEQSESIIAWLRDFKEFLCIQKQTSTKTSAQLLKMPVKNK